MRAEAEEEKVSGKHSCGMTPCFRMRLTHMSHWPPSETGWLSSHWTRRPS
eukprot:COSAG04_NODE_730_length_10737_cov_31.931002_15_plen_50_part_00